MQIHLEKASPHSIQAYSDTEIKIDNTLYQQSLIVNANTLIVDWSITHISQLSLENLDILLNLKPKIIILGHTPISHFLNASLTQALLQQGIGIECMSIGAACRTYNVLMSENREVVLGVIVEKK